MTSDSSCTDLEFGFTVVVYRSAIVSAGTCSDTEISLYIFISMDPLIAVINIIGTAIP